MPVRFLSGKQNSDLTFYFIKDFVNDKYMIKRIFSEGVSRERGHSTPMVNSCLCMTEVKPILKTIIKQLKINKFDY